MRRCLWGRMSRADGRGRLAVFFLAFALLAVLTACQPSYRPAVLDPMATTAEDSPSYIDFLQIHNDIVERYSEGDESFPYVKDVEIDGDDGEKWVAIRAEIVEGTSEDALQIFLSTMLYDISEEAVIQDRRYSAPEAGSFGTFYNDYELRVSLSRDGEVWEDAVYGAGDPLPYDPANALPFIMFE